MTRTTRRYCPRCFEAYEDGQETCPEHDFKLVSLAGGGEDLAGRVIDEKYEIVDILGQGGMGTVYRARHMVIGREVALKVLRKDYLEDHKGVARFVREAKAASLLKSRYSAMLHDFGLAPEGFLYYTMELATGRLLSDIIDRDGAVGPERTMHIAADVCHSLAEAHANNIVHRDIKADNIMISQDPDGHEIGKVLDFGTAKLIDTTDRSSRVTDPGIICGTPEYMSPEQAQAFPVDGRSDIYSLGVLMFELLTGRLPFEAGNRIALLLKHVNDEPPRPSESLPANSVPVGLEGLIMAMLAKEPSGRPRSAVAVLRELQRLLEEYALLTGSDSDISAHESFALDAKTEEAYRAPRGNTLVSMMSLPDGEPAWSSGPSGGRPTMELSPGHLWHETQDRSTTEEDLEMVDTVRALGEGSAGPARGLGEDLPPYANLADEAGSEMDSVTPVAGTGKLSVLPSAVLRGVDAAALRGKSKPLVSPALLALVVGCLLGGAALLLMVYSGFFEQSSAPMQGGGAAQASSRSEQLLRLSDAGVGRRLPGDLLVEEDAVLVVDSGSEVMREVPDPELEEIMATAPEEVVAQIAPVDLVNLDNVRWRDAIDLVSSGEAAGDVVATVDGRAADASGDAVPEDVVSSSETREAVSRRLGGQAAAPAGSGSKKARKEKGAARKAARKQSQKKKTGAARKGPVEFTLDDLQ